MSETGPREVDSLAPAQSVDGTSKSGRRETPGAASTGTPSHAATPASTTAGPAHPSGSGAGRSQGVATDAWPYGGDVAIALALHEEREGAGWGCQPRCRYRADEPHPLLPCDVA